jgi:hypothetical protein
MALSLPITKSAQHIVEALVLEAKIDGFIVSDAQSVTVPSITDPDIAKVDVTITGAAVGDFVLVGPNEALPTNCRLQGAFVTATDTVTFVFGSEGGNVTGAAKSFDVVVISRR